MNSYRRSAGGTCGRFARAAFVLCCLLVFGFQQFAAQTHIHTVTAAAGRFVLQDRIVDGYPPSDHHDDADDGCALCQLAIAVGSGVVGTPPVLDISRPSIETVFRALRLAASELPPGHIWRSRAPPVNV